MCVTHYGNITECVCPSGLNWQLRGSVHSCAVGGCVDLVPWAYPRVHPLWLSTSTIGTVKALCPGAPIGENCNVQCGLSVTSQRLTCEDDGTWSGAATCPATDVCDYTFDGKVTCTRVTSEYISSFPSNMVALDVAAPSAANLRALLVNATTLVTLRSAFGMIEVLDNSTIAGVPSLIDLNLSNNRITLIFAGAFAVQRKLLTLRIGSNRFTVLLPETFEPLTSLRTLDLALTGGGGMSLQSLSFLHAGIPASLESLSVSRNSELAAALDAISYFSDVPKLVNLTTFDMSHIPVRTKRPPAFLHHLTRLTHLFMTECDIEVLPKAALVSLTGLHELFLYDNRITAIEPGAFSGLPHGAKVLMGAVNPSKCVEHSPWSCLCPLSFFSSVNGSGCIAPCAAVNAPSTLLVDLDREGVPLARTLANCTVSDCADNGVRGPVQCLFDGTWVPEFTCVNCHASFPRPTVLLTTPIVPSTAASPSTATMTPPISSYALHSTTTLSSSTQTTTTPTTTTADQTSSEDLAPVSSPASKLGSVVGAVAGTLAGLVIVVVIMVWYRRRDPGAGFLPTRKPSRIRARLVQIIKDKTHGKFVRQFGHALTSIAAHSESFGRLEVASRDLTLVRRIGEGQSGIVWLGKMRTTGARDVALTRRTVKTEADVAVKLSESSEAEVQEQVLLEAHVLHLLRHPYIVAIVAISTQEMPMRVVTEYMNGGDLKTFLRACRPTNAHVRTVIGPEEMARMCLQTASALEYLESKQVIHRDIAARNVLANVDGSVVKLADLGAARDIYRTEVYMKTSTARMPIAWMAPESLTDQVYTHKSDVWSFGVLLWEVTSFAKTPYGALGVQEVVAEVVGGHHLPQPPACPSALSTVMKRCWAMQPASRPTFAAIVDELTTLTLPRLIDLGGASVASAGERFEFTRTWESPYDQVRLGGSGASARPPSSSHGDRGECRGSSVAVVWLGDEHDASDLGRYSASDHRGVEEATAIREQLARLRALVNDNLVTMIGWLHEPSSSARTGLVLGWTERGSLDTILLAPGGLSAVGLRTDQVILDIAKGMEYLSQRRMSHSALRAAHCLVTGDGRVVLASPQYWRRAGSAITPTHARAHARWMSPHGFTALVADTRMDLYAYGAVVFEVMSGGLVPHADLDDARLLLQLQDESEKNLNLVFPTGTSEDLVGMVGTCRASTPAARPTFSQIVVWLEDGMGGSNRWEMDPTKLTLIRQLGSGLFGTVMLMAAADLAGPGTAMLVAVKTLQDTGADASVRAEFLGEMALMKQLRHPNLVGLVAVCTRVEAAMMVMEYMRGGSLDGWLDEKAASMGQEALLHIAHQIALGMEALGLAGIVHRDLAARNVLIGEGLRAKVSDYGMSRALGGEKEYYRIQKNRPMPLRWMAAEILDTGKWTTATDVWAYGMVLFEIFSGGHTPFPGLDSNEVADALRVLQRGPALAPPSGCPGGVGALLQECVSLPVSVRPTFLAIVERTEPGAWHSLLGKKDTSLTGAKIMSDSSMATVACNTYQPGGKGVLVLTSGPSSLPRASVAGVVGDEQSEVHI